MRNCQNVVSSGSRGFQAVKHRAPGENTLFDNYTYLRTVIYDYHGTTTDELRLASDNYVLLGALPFGA